MVITVKGRIRGSRYDTVTEKKSDIVSAEVSLFRTMTSNTIIIRYN